VPARTPTGLAGPAGIINVKEEKNTKIRRPIIFLSLLAVVGAGVWLWLSSRHEESRNNIVLYGNVDIRQVELAFNGNERISRLLAEEGDRIQEGQLMGILETDRLRHEVASASAKVKAQTEVVKRLKAGSRPEEIRKARADVKAAEAEAINADSNYRRLNFLAEKGSVTLQQRDDARAASESAQARLQAAREVLELAVIGPRKEDIAEAEATLNAYKAELAVSQQRLNYAYLYAPADGVIRDRVMEPGDMASPQKTVYTLALTNPVWVRAYVSEPDLGKIKLGMVAEAGTDSYPGKKYKGWVGFISPAAEFTPKSVETLEVRSKLVYQVRIYICNPQNELRLGMPATVTVPLNQTLKEKVSDQDRCKNP
jgi:HlyD family secretion protein